MSAELKLVTGPAPEGVGVIVLALSGGLDSSTLLAHARTGYPGVPIIPVYLDYGSKHRDRELECAKAIPPWWQAHPLRHFRLPEIWLSGDSTLLGSSPEQVPAGAYDSENMKATVVPGRNLIIISILAAIAEAELVPGDPRKAMVLYGAHAGDHVIYPDCRPGFVAWAAQAVEASSGGRVTLLAPFIHMDKGDIVILGSHLGVDYAGTWTCYRGGTKPCGVCGACDERAAAFRKAGRTDPLINGGRV